MEDKLLDNQLKQSVFFQTHCIFLIYLLFVYKNIFTWCLFNKFLEILHEETIYLAQGCCNRQNGHLFPLHRTQIIIIPHLLRLLCYYPMMLLSFRQNVVSEVEKSYLKNGKFTELLAHQEHIGQQQEEMVCCII